MVMKSRTRPFSTEKSATSFAKLVNGKVTKQHIRFSKYVWHVHYKSDGIYRGKRKEIDFTYDFEGYTHNYNDI
jgi:hypothetical protein